MEVHLELIRVYLELIKLRLQLMEMHSELSEMHFRLIEVAAGQMGIRAPSFEIHFPWMGMDLCLLDAQSTRVSNEFQHRKPREKS